MYISHGRLCVCVSVRDLVCLSACLSLHSRTTALEGMVGMPSTCALLDRFAIGAWVSLL